MLREDNPHMKFIVYVVNRNHWGACFLLQTIVVLCDQNAIQLHRYGIPTWFPKTPKLVLIQALCVKRILRGKLKEAAAGYKSHVHHSGTCDPSCLTTSC